MCSIIVKSIQYDFVRCTLLICSQFNPLGGKARIFLLMGNKKNIDLFLKSQTITYFYEGEPIDNLLLTGTFLYPKIVVLMGNPWKTFSFNLLSALMNGLGTSTVSPLKICKIPGHEKLCIAQTPACSTMPGTSWTLNNYSQK